VLVPMHIKTFRPFLKKYRGTLPVLNEGRDRLSRLVKVPRTTMCLLVYWSRRKGSVIEGIAGNAFVPWVAAGGCELIVKYDVSVQ